MRHRSSKLHLPGLHTDAGFAFACSCNGVDYWNVFRTYGRQQGLLLCQRSTTIMKRMFHAVFTAMLIVGSMSGVGAVTGQQGTAAQQQTGDGTPVTVPGTQTKGPFTLTSEEVSICGLTCREVTVTLSNQGNETLTNVTVESEILANDEVIVQRQMENDRLHPNKSVTRTIQVNVGPDALQQIRQGNGMITVQTQVNSDRHNETFISQRPVV